MNEDLSHEVIARRLLESGAVNFDAIGKFVADIGPDLLQYDKGLHGVLFGRYNQLACFLPAGDLANIVGDLTRARQVANDLNVER